MVLEILLKTLIFPSDNVKGIWGNDEYIWVLDVENGSIDGYDKEIGAYISGNPIIDPDSDNANPVWCFGNDTHIFVGDSTNTSTLYAYKMSSASYDENSNISITLHSNNSHTDIVGGYI